MEGENAVGTIKSILAIGGRWSPMEKAPRNKSQPTTGRIRTDVVRHWKAEAGQAQR